MKINIWKWVENWDEFAQFYETPIKLLRSYYNFPCIGTFRGSIKNNYLSFKPLLSENGFIYIEVPGIYSWLRKFSDRFENIDGCSSGDNLDIFSK